MGATDWLLQGSGDPVVDTNVDHTTVPNQQLSHDTKAHKFTILTGSGGNGKSYYRYTRQIFQLTQDLSVRMAMSMALQGTQLHSVGVGLRLSDDVVPGAGNTIDRFAQNGYQLVLADNGVSYLLTLNRVVAGVPTLLFSATKIGTTGQFKWFHFRLDFLKQQNDSAVLQVWESDPALNPVPTPLWTKISPDILENALAIPPYAGVGFGVQGYDGGTGYDLYCDWVEILRK